LNQLVDYKKTNDLSYSAIQLSLWQRLLRPVETLIMIFLAVPFVFGSLRHASMGVRLTVGVVVGFIFYLLTQYVGFLSLVYNVSPIISASLPLLLIILFALFLIRKRF
jgi:lipopolysaccharide export system permease protein